MNLRLPTSAARLDSRYTSVRSGRFHKLTSDCDPTPNYGNVTITVINLVMMTIMIMVMVMMSYTENDNETLCCRIMIMIMKMTSVLLCSGNCNERNVMTPILVTLVVDHLAIWQYHIWPRQTWLCTSSMSWCVCSWLDDPVVVGWMIVVQTFTISVTKNAVGL